MSSPRPSSQPPLPGHEPEEQPSHLLRAQRWDELAATLCDLNFVASRCAAGRLAELQAEYAAALEAFPEARTESEQQAARRAEMERFLEALVASQGKGPLPPAPAVVPWSEEQTWAECDRLSRQPTRLDRVRLFADFVAAERRQLQLHGSLPGFCVQQALNHADAGPVVEAAEALVRARGELPLIRCHPRQRPPFNPRPARLRSLEGHQGAVTAAALTPDGRLALTGGEDRSVRVWDVAAGRCLHTLTGHTGALFSLAVTPDGRTAVSGAEDNSLRAWDTVTGDCLRTVALDLPPRHVALTVDGRLALAACQDHSPEVWDLTTGQRVAAFEQVLPAHEAAALLPDGRAVVVAAAGHALEVLDPADGRCLLTLAGHTDRVTELRPSVDGRRLVSAGDDRTVRVWDLATGECLRVLSGLGSVRFARPSVDASLVVVGTGKATTRIWDVSMSTKGQQAGGRRLRNLVNGPRTSTELGQTPDGKLLVLDGAAVWDVATGQTDLMPSAFPGDDATDNPLLGLHVAPRSEVVLAARRQAPSIWGLASASRLRTLDGPGAEVTAACLTADGRTVIAAHADGTLRAWDVPGGVCRWAQEAHAGRINAVALTGDGRTVVSAGADRTLRVSDLADGDCLRALGGCPEGVTHLALSPDGRTAVLADEGGSLHVWDLAAGKSRARLPGTAAAVTALVVTADGSVTVSASRDGTLRVWQVAAGAWHLLQGHTGAVLDVCLTPSGRLAVSAGADGSVRVWDLAGGACLRALQGNPGAVAGVRVSPDGQTVVSFGGADGPDGTVAVWELATGRCLAVLPAGRALEGLSEVRQDGRFAFGQAGAVKPALPAGIPTGEPCVTAVRRMPWDEPDSGDGEWTTCCPHCGEETTPAPEVLDAIRRLVNGLSPDQAPVLDLPPEAWDTPELRGACGRCGGPLRFNPFAAGLQTAPPAAGTPAVPQGAPPPAGEDDETLRRLASDPPALRLVLAFTADPGREQTSPLAARVAEALLRGESGHDVAALLHEACWNGDNPLAQGEALVGLAALGFDPTPVLESARAEPALREGARAAETLLADLGRSLAERLAAVADNLTPLLRAALPQCAPGAGREVVRSVCGVLAAYGSRDYNPADAWGEVPELQAVLAAEFWSLLAHAEAGPANLTALLETARKHLGASPLLLAESLAGAAGARQWLAEHRDRWPLDELAPRPPATADLLAEALDALAALPRGLEQVHAWVLGRLGPLLVESGLTAETVVAAVTTLPERSAGLTDAVTALLPGDAGTGLLAEPGPRAALLTLARAVAEPWPRFRALRRLLLSFRSGRGEVLPEALTAAREIGDAGRRCRALEQLVFLVPAEQRPALLGQALAAARAGADPDNRARALGRLAAHYPPPLAARPLREALGAIGTVADAGPRAELLDLFRPLLLPHPELRGQARELADQLGDETARARARGMLAPPLLLQQDTLAEAVPERPETAATLTLAALVHDTLHRSARPLTAAGLWEALAEGHEPARPALEQRGEAAGLRLTRTAAGALDGLLAAGDADAVRSLLRLVQKPGPNVIPYLYRWRGHADAGIRQQANLLLAEAEGLSDHTLPGLLGLATAPDDRSRHRAALAMHGSTLAWASATRLSRVGLETLNLLARAWLRYRDRDPHLALLLFRTYQHVLHDDPAALATLAAAVQAGGRDADTAEASLRLIASITAPAWEALLRALREGNGRTQRALLETVLSLAGNARLPEGGADKLAAVVPALDRAALTEWRALVGGPRVVVQAAALLLGLAPDSGRERVAAAMGAAVRDRAVPVATLLAQPAVVLPAALGAVGQVPYRTAAYEELVRAAAQVVAGNPGLVLILAQRLLSLLAESPTEASLLYPERRDLLNVLAAAAAQAPGLLAAAANLDGWETLLAGAATRSFFRAARVSALRLLGGAGRLNRTVAETVRTALRDTPEALTAARDLVAAAGSVDEEAVGVLVAALADEAPSVAWNAAAVLSVLVRKPHLGDEQRRTIHTALAKAAADPRASRAVYVLEEAHVPERGQVLTLRYLGRLGQAFRHA